MKFEEIEQHIRLYSTIYRTTSFFFIILCILCGIFCLKIIFFTHHQSITLDDTNQSNIILQPALQLNELHKNLIYIQAESGAILNNKEYKFYNVTMHTADAKVFSKTADVYNNGDKIVLKERPYVIFTNNNR